MISRSLFLIVFFITSNLFAQGQQKIDSLESELSKVDNSLEKVDILHDLWSENINNDIDKAIDYSNQMIKLGNALKIDTILSLGFEKKATAYAYMNKFDSSGVYFRKALKIYDDSNDFQGKADVLRNLGQDQNMMNNWIVLFIIMTSPVKTIKKSMIQLV